jgi:hypothetical protein
MAALQTRAGFKGRSRAYFNAKPVRAQGLAAVFSGFPVVQAFFKTKWRWRS